MDTEEIVRKTMQNIKENNKKNSKESKKDYHFIGWYLMNKGKLPRKWHNESKVVARRTYQYYSIGIDDWEGPSPRKFGKMGKQEFQRLLKGREELKGGILWKGTLTNDQQSRETEGTIRDGKPSHNQVYETEGTA